MRIRPWLLKFRLPLIMVLWLMPAVESVEIAFWMLVVRTPPKCFSFVLDSVTLFNRPPFFDTANQIFTSTVAAVAFVAVRRF